MKKILFFLIYLGIVSISLQQSFADETKTFTKKIGYELYKHNVENFCKEYKNTDTSSELLYTLDESSYFQEISNTDSQGLEQAVADYEKNMDDIYFCATNINYKRQIEVVKDELINSNAKLSAKMKKSLDAKIKQISQKINNMDGTCKIQDSSNETLIKKSILRQTTYELCKYNFYLEYLKEYNKNNLGNLQEADLQNGVAIGEIVMNSSKKQHQIETEITKAYRAFPLVFQAYSDFENNIGTHILLELLREDYNTFREELHRTLNPINQVVYKISNAMRK